MRIELLEGKLEQPSFWDNVSESQNVMKELKNLKDTIEEFEELKGQYEDIETMISLMEEENDESFVGEIGELLDSFKTNFDAFKIKTLLSGEFDGNNAVLTLHAGTGGTEACDCLVCFIVCISVGLTRRALA